MACYQSPPGECAGTAVRPWGYVGRAVTLCLPIGALLSGLLLCGGAMRGQHGRTRNLECRWISFAYGFIYGFMNSARYNTTAVAWRHSSSRSRVHPPKTSMSRSFQRSCRGVLLIQQRPPQVFVKLCGIWAILGYPSGFPPDM